MSKSNNVDALLLKLDTAMGKKREQFVKTDWAAVKAEKEKSFTKLAPGKNQIAVVPMDIVDPFTFWGYHNSLQETSYWSVPCDAYNKDKECIVCNVIEELKKEDEAGNKHIWNPIRQQLEFYVPIVNLESEETIKEGVKWWRFGKSIMGTFKEWLSNSNDDGDEPFYSEEEPQKITITYNKGVAFSDMYKLDKKNMKPFSKNQLAEWKGSLKPISDFIFSKSQEDLKKIVDDYFDRIANEVSLNPENEIGRELNKFSNETDNSEVEIVD